MITPKLWAALNRPPAMHPLFRRTVVLPVVQERFYLSWANLVIGVILGLSQYSPLLLFLLMPPILVIVGLTYGLDCALRVSGAITREHEHNTYHLLSLSPPGQMGAMWTLCTSALYRKHDFIRLRNMLHAALLTGLYGGGAVTIIVVLVNLGLFTRYPQPVLPMLFAFGNFAAILGAIWAEYLQSAVLGVLLGMLISTYTHSRLDASLWAFGLYLLLQTATYVLTVLVGFTLLPVVFERLSLMGDYTLAVLSLLRLLILVVGREALVVIIWRALLERLNLTTAELDFIKH
ncbi:MAG TPA: hypothetical protein VHO69_04320 [Phototrophicaceae bacterium]|nr:hypothetical protein [Phototrophicaceae bacterium]